ncbi:Broad-complex core protein isoform 6, partial [Caligus rogercresseyi]
MNEKLNAEINKLIKRTPDGLYQCIPCKKTTKRLQNLQFHVESLHVITDGFECKFCGTVLKTRQSHQKHVKKHERTPAYVQTR